MEKKRTLLFCLFTDIINSNSKKYSLDKFYGLILSCQTNNDIVASHITEAEKEEEVELNCGKYSITIKRKNLFLEEEFDKFKEHVINSISAYYGVYPGQVIKEFSRSNIILWSSKNDGKLTILIPFKPSDIKPANSNKWSVRYASPVFNLVPPLLGPLCDSNYCCEDALFLIPIPQQNETFYTFGKDGVLVGFKPCDEDEVKVSVRKQMNGRIHELTLENILEENTNKPITLKIQIIEPSHHCNIFRTKEEALNSLRTL